MTQKYLIELEELGSMIIEMSFEVTEGCDIITSSNLVSNQTNMDINTTLGIRDSFHNYIVDGLINNVEKNLGLPDSLLREDVLSNNFIYFNRQEIEDNVIDGTEPETLLKTIVIENIISNPINIASGFKEYSLKNKIYKFISLLFLQRTPSIKQKRIINYKEIKDNLLQAISSAPRISNFLDYKTTLI